MVDTHVILARVDKIRECLARLKKFGSLDERDFLADPSLTDSAERNLQIAIQAVIDIGNHIVSDLDLGTPNDYKDIFRLLAKGSIISDPLAARLSSMTGLRNILVHDYLEIDLRLIYQIIKADLGDFEEFISATLRLI